MPHIFLKHVLMRTASCAYPNPGVFASRYLFGCGVILKSRKTFSSSITSDISSRVQIRPALKTDVPTLADIYNAEAWNYMPETIETFVDIAGDSFLVAELDGKVVGSVMANILGDNDAFGGLAAIVPEFRRKGIAKKMWKERSKIVGDRNFGVVSVAHRQHILHDNGFSIATDRIDLLEGRINASSLTTTGDNEIEIIPANEIKFDLLLNYDTEIHTIPRPVFLEKFLDRPSSRSFVAVDKKSSCIVGYAIVQPGITGYRIAPLFADTPNATKILLKRALQSFPSDAPVDFYLNTSNSVYTEMIDKNKDSLRLVIDCVKMFTLLDVPIPHRNKVLAYSSPEMALV